MKLGLIAFFQSLFALSLFAQPVQKFERFIQQADSALQAKNHARSIQLYEIAIALPDGKEKISNVIYYNIACAYSLNGQKDLAFRYLEKCFSAPAGKKAQELGAFWVSSDSDLTSLHEDARFGKLLTRFFPGTPIELLLAKEISYDQLLQMIANANLEEDFAISGKTIYWKKVNDQYVMNTTSLPMPNFSLCKKKPLRFLNCTFKLNLLWYGDSGKGNKYRQEFPYKGLEINSCKFEGSCIFFGIDLSLPLQIQNTTFENDFSWIGKVVHEDDLNFYECKILQCSFHWAYFFIQPSARVGFRIADNKSLDSSDFRMRISKVTSAKIYDNQFARKNVEIQFNEADYLQVNDNQFNSLELIATKVNSEFIFSKNKLFGELLFMNSHFTDEPGNNIGWKQIEESGLGLMYSYPTLNSINPDIGLLEITRKADLEYFTGNDTTAIASEDNFNQLMGLYSRFLNLYKNKNNIELYNQCFIAMKTIQSKRLAYLYQNNPTFERYFRWKLSQLLKYYVRYGTDPARAIVISIYIIIAFGVFFFFFPSDWDVTSKKRLIENFKDFIQKNEKGYIKPFFILLGGFIFSLINAVTLSLNAFITLGFGNIPTHGIARYFCVLEGFLGWFLLSIFTVAMINQVL
jgi:hypothetical protein